MKILTKITLVAAMVSLAVSSFAAPPRRDGRLQAVVGGGPTNAPAGGTNCVPAGMTNSATFTARLAETYTNVAPYDANADAQLDETEQAALATAIVDGTFTLPAPPHARQGTNAPPSPNAQMSANLAAHLAAEYAVIAPFDANHDGALDDAEQQALTDAIAAGTVDLPRPGRGGPRGHGGRR